MKDSYLGIYLKSIFKFLAVGIFFSAIATLGLIQHKFPVKFFQPHISQKLSTTSFLVSNTQANHLPVRSIYVKVWGGMAIYKILEADIQDDGNQINFLLKIQPNGDLNNPYPAIRKYQTVISQQLFDSFWQQLQILDAGYLPSAVPRGHRPGESSEEDSEPAQFVIDAPSYYFTIQDQKQEINHQFQVYAPYFVEDKRYQEVVIAFEELIEMVFGNQPFSDLVK